MKICLICSPGGHLIECLSLLDAFKKDDTLFLITHSESFDFNLSRITRYYLLKNIVVKNVNSSRIIKFLYLGKIIYSKCI